MCSTCPHTRDPARDGPGQLPCERPCVLGLAPASTFFRLCLWLLWGSSLPGGSFASVPMLWPMPGADLWRGRLGSQVGSSA
eukprot:13104260-Heterocapsa_arctica.AAC.1